MSDDLPIRVAYGGARTARRNMVSAMSAAGCPSTPSCICYKKKASHGKKRNRGVVPPRLRRLRRVRAAPPAPAPRAPAPAKKRRRRGRRIGFNPGMPVFGRM